MPYIGTYAFRFWIKSDAEKTISFSCDTTFKDFNIGQDWSCIQMVFEVDQISNIYIELPIGEYWVYNTKLEVGQYHTDWSPHPEDGNQNYDDKLAEIEQTLIEYRSEISRTQSYVDQVQQQIINSVSKTTYESDIQGLTQSISDKFQNVEEGYDKWYVSFYDKSQFKDTKLDDDMDDRERFDLGVFLLDNSSLNPIDEKLIDDTPASMRVDGRGKVVYYLAFAKFSRATVINTQMNYNKASLYINGIQVFIAPQQALIGTTNVILNFSAGWNMIEIISNEGNLSFNTKISKHENCEQFNCLIAVPTQHSAKIREQGAYLNIYLDKIVSEVFDSYMEDVYDDQGHYIGQRKVLRSKIEQAADKISLLVESMQTDGQGNITSLTLTDNAIQAITNQFIISDEEGHNVVISGGKIWAESITSAMLSTDAIKSRNYVPNEKPLEDESLPINDSDLMEIIQNYIDISDPNYIYDSKLYMIDDEGFIGYSKTGTFIDLANGKISTPSLYIDSTQQRAFFKGTVFADNGVFRGIVYATDGVFKGTVYAESGEFSGGIYADYGVFNGTVYAEDGVFNGTVYATNGRFTGEVISDVARLGPWILNSTSLYKGTGILGTHGGSNIYLGDAGFSLGDRLIYDAANESIMLAPSAITFAGRDIDAELNGQKEWYSVGIPTLNNYPAVDWVNNGTEAEHVGNFYYDMNSGIAYCYENYSGSNYKISFNSNTDIKANDSISIYYRHVNVIFKVSTTITGTNVPDIVIPTDNFYLHWHTLSGAAVDHYGFAIDSVSKTSDSTTLAVSQNSLPNIPVDASYTAGVYPETEHPYQSVDQDKMWLVRAADSGSTYVWRRVYNTSDTAKIAANSKSLNSFMHYDANNGLIFYNSSANLPNRILTQQDLDNNTALKGNIRITEDGMGVYTGNNLLASFGSTITFYRPGSNIVATAIDANGLNINYGIISLGSLNATTFTDLWQSGAYIANNGNFLFGNPEAYIQYNGYTMNIAVDSITFGNSRADLEQVIDNIENHIATLDGEIIGTNTTYVQDTDPSLQWTASEMQDHVGDTWFNTASSVNYIWDGNVWQQVTTGNQYMFYNTTDGLVIHQSGANVNSSANVTGANIRLNSTNCDIYNNNRLLARYGATTYYYCYQNNVQQLAAQLGTDGLVIRKGGITLGTNGSSDYMYFGSTGMTLYNKLIYNASTNALQLNVDSLNIGGVSYSSIMDNKIATYLHYDASNGLIVYNGTNPLPSGYPSNAQLESLQSNIRLTSNGIGIYTGNTRYANFGSTITLGLTTGKYVTVDSNGMTVYNSNGNATAKFGSTIEMCTPGGILAVQLNSYGFNLYKGSLTIGKYFSVSHGGEIIAKKGTIGPMNIGYMNEGQSGQYEATWIGERDNYDERDLVGIVLESNSNMGVGCPLLSNSNRITNFIIGDSGKIEMCTYLKGVNPFIKTQMYFLTTGTSAIECNYKQSYSADVVNIFTLTYSGNISISGSLSQASDERLKNIRNESLLDYKDLFMSIKPISFKWKDESKEQTIHFGVGANNMRNLLEDDNYANLSIVDDDNPDVLNVRYNELFMLSLAVTQEHEKEINTLKSEIALLKEQIANLTRR